MDGQLSEFFEWGFKAMTTAFAAFGFKSIASAHKKAEDNKDGLSAFKLEATEKFAKEVNVHASLSRLHDRMDEVSNDIKTILTRIPNDNGKHHQ